MVQVFGLSALILFFCSGLRHVMYKSAAFDLGIFDQAVFLISQQQIPFSTLRQIHIVGDHAAFVLYPLGWLYGIYPSVYWLFAAQAVMMAAAVFPLSRLARLAGLRDSQVVALVLAYLLYPAVFNINLYDFHPETLALPAFFWAVWSARIGKIVWFCINLVLILSCKDVLSITVAAMGLWLIVFEKKRLAGAIALFAGIVWFLIATQKIVPEFSGSEPAGLELYSYLGSSIAEVAKNLFFQPGLVLGKIFSLNTLIYLCLLLSPVIWGLAPQHLAPIVAAVPALLLNILSSADLQRNLVHQYSLPIIPFIFLAVIQNLSLGGGWFDRRGIIIWSLVAFLALAKYGYFWSIYSSSLDTWQATNAAIAQVNTQGSVYTTAEIAPHLTHRKLIRFTEANSPPLNLTEFNYILLNARHPGWESNHEFANRLVDQLKNNQKFKLSYQRDDVYLFKQ